MENNRRQILDMLAEGKIGVEEAERLLSLVSPEDESAGSDGKTKKSRPQVKYLRVCVERGDDAGEDDTERVNIRVPMALIRAGVKLAALIPTAAVASMNKELKKKGVEFDIGTFKAEDVEALIDALQDLEVDVQGGHGKVRVFVE